MPDRIVLRDAGALWPVAPFVELWCDAGPDGQPGNRRRVPLTAAMLLAEGLNMANLTFTIEAMNFKAARRTNDPDLRLGTFPQFRCSAASTPRKRFSVSARRRLPHPWSRPAEASRSAASRSSVRPINPPPAPRPGMQRWTSMSSGFASAGDRAILRPNRNCGNRRHHWRYVLSRVPTTNAFLNGNAGWLNAEGMRALIAPADTFDCAEQPSPRSLGIVDDTCEVRVTVTLDRSQIGGTALKPMPISSAGLPLCAGPSTVPVACRRPQ